MRSSDIALVALVVIVVALSIGSVRLDSATADEPAHIANGVIKLTEGWLNFFREQPPLMNSLSAAPVVLAGYRVQPGWKGKDHWVVGRRFLYYSGFDAHRILFLARLPTIALFAALCVVMYMFVLRQTGSRAWALFAAALSGFCPNLMAHARLATVDFALTFFAFSAAVLFIALIARPRATTAILLGVMTAAAALSKISGLILGPYFLVLLAIAFVIRRVDDPRRLMKALAIAAAAALVFFEAFMLLETSAAYAREQYPTMPRLVVPFAEYIANVQTIRVWYTRGHTLPQFLLGRFSFDSWPEYYPTAFLLKTTLPAIVLFVMALVVGIRRRSFPFLALLLFVALFFAVAAMGHLALGIRYVLPIYPFLYAATAIALSQPRPEARGPRPMILVGVLLLWHIGENLATYPSYIAYFNELIGSRANADKFLIDSNLDWGQDLRRLDAWCRENKVSQITVHYFGGGDVDYDIRAARPLVRYGPGPGLLPKGYFALSRHFYRLSFYPPLFGIDYDAYLAASHARYITTIGGSINIYRVE